MAPSSVRTMVRVDNGTVGSRDDGTVVRMATEPVGRTIRSSIFQNHCLLQPVVWSYVFSLFRIKKQLVTFIGKENVAINGKKFETDHFKLTSEDMSLPEDKRLNFDIWLDKKTSVIVKVTYERMGNWEYRLKNIE